MYSTVSHSGNLYNSVDFGLRGLTDPVMPTLDRAWRFLCDVTALGSLFAAVFIGLMAA